MMGWWRQREPRERLLLAFAAVVAVAALLVQGLVLPSLRNRDDAARSVKEAESTLVRLAQLKDQGVSHAGPPAADARRRALEYAAEAQLALRGAVPPSGDLRFAFDPAAPTIVFSWIDRVETSLGLTVQSAEMISSGAGRVEAIVEFSGDQAP